MALTGKWIPDNWKAERLREKEETLMEINGSNAVHRVQVLTAWNGGKLREESIDLGPAKDFKHDLLQVESLGFTSVGKVRFLAEEARQQKNFSEEAGLPQTFDMMDALEQYMTEAWNKRHHRSVFGPELVRVRN